MKLDKPNYYSILPATVRYDDDLTDSEKILYSEIVALADKTGQCWAGNTYFSKLYKVTPETISRRISKLRKKGYITVEILYKNNTKEIDRRIVKIINTYPQDNQGGIDAIINRGIDAIVKDNTTSINTTSTNTTSTNDTSTNCDYNAVILYLNDKANKKFRNAESNNKFIRARCNEGYTLENFKQVIDTKTKEWLNTDMNKYLQPSTLFGNKFDQYLNQEKQGEDENEIERFGITI